MTSTLALEKGAPTAISRHKLALNCCDYLQWAIVGHLDSLLPEQRIIIFKGLAAFKFKSPFFRRKVQNPQMPIEIHYNSK